MWPSKIKGREYELFFVFSLVFVLLAVMFTHQSLTRTVEIVEILCPQKVKVGQSFQVTVVFRTEGYNLIAVAQGYVSTGEAGQLGQYARTMVYMQNPGTSNVTLSLTEPFHVTKANVVIEFLSPIGQGLATQSVPIEVEL
ncbi:MAG: hypothetical protein ACUVQ8_04810 [Nitrososphaeria archaeon]